MGGLEEPVSVSAADAAIEGLNAAAVGLDDFPNAADLVELDLQLVDLAQDFVEAGYLGVGVGYDIAGAVVLHLGGCLGLLGELQSVSVGNLGARRGWRRLTWAQRCWMLCSRRSK